MGSKKTIKLVDKVLKNQNKRELYTKEELAYMELQLTQMKLHRQRRKYERKLKKGFGY